jgi:proline iminopeptidase
MNSLRKFALVLGIAVVALFAFALVHCVHAQGAIPRHEESGQTFDGPGGKIYYEVTGSGSATPLLIVNGGPGFDHRYEHITTAWNQIGKNRKVIFYDQRGNGQSSALKSGEPNTLADQIADLDALRAHLGLDRVELLGHSWGGYLSMAYAARHPEHIAHLILVDSAAPKWSDIIFLFNQVFPETIERQNAVAFANALGDKAAADTNIHEYLSMLFYSPEHRDAFLAAMPSGAYNKDVNQSLNSDLGRYDLNPEIRKFRFPVLIVTGRYDMNVAPVIAYRMHQAILGSRFVVFERSGHIPFYEEPDAFVRTLEDFLAGR